MYLPAAELQVAEMLAEKAGRRLSTWLRDAVVEAILALRSPPSATHPRV